jgi:hypothetical protein
MNTAIDMVQKKLGITINEFTVAGFAYDGLFAHRWYIGTNDLNVDSNRVREIIDEALSEVNDDYAVERTAALKEIFVEILPDNVFIEYLRGQGKEGAMNKFPRVMKGEKLKDWEKFLSVKSV